MRRNPKSLKNKRILLGITGSVAAYKAVDLIKRLKEEEASVDVVMTDASKHFVTPHSLQQASGSEVHTDLYDEPMAHIRLPAAADLFLVVPATANTIGKFATGIADDLLSACYLAFKGTVVIAPAMNWRMYASQAVKKNINILKERGAIEIPPVAGRLACGEEGIGRMAEVSAILEVVKAAFFEKDLVGKRIVVTAGPTREHIDSVRFISNRSSGKMGYALARAALRRGAEVYLISGPTALEIPVGANVVNVVSAMEMRDAVREAIRDADVLIMAAAVADITPEAPSHTKLDKSVLNDNLRISRTSDILAEVGRERERERPMLIGFAAEAGANVERARDKLLRKGADLIVLNDITEAGAGFEADTNRIIIVEREKETEYPLMPKDDVADMILDRILN